MTHRVLKNCGFCAADDDDGGDGVDDNAGGGLLDAVLWHPTW